MFAKVIKLILMMVELDDSNNIKIENGCYEVMIKEMIVIVMTLIVVLRR
jgi:hypothetical protein